MPVVPLALPRVQLFDANGNPLSGGKLDTYAAQTTTPLTSYSNALGTIANSNPVIADAGGYMDVYLTAGVAYRLRVRSALDVVLGTIDNVVLDPQASLTTIGGASSTVTAHNATLDPGEPGAEVLTTNAEQDIQQLRFRIGEMTGVNWAQTYTTRHYQVSIRTQMDDNTIWTSTGSTAVNIRAFVPDGWQQSTPFTLKVFRRALTAVAGTAKMYFQYARIRDGEAVNLSTTAAVDFTPPDLFCHLVSLEFAGTNFLPGDVIFALVGRTADDAGDTYNGGIACDGAFIEYFGVGSR